MTGKLKDGWFYVKDNHNNVYPARYVTMQHKFAQFLPREIVEVIAPVPTYDELSNLETKIEVAQVRNDELIEINATLSSQNKHLLNLQKEVNKGDRIIGCLLNESSACIKGNKRLRELLKECKEKIHQEFICSDYLSIDKFFDLINRINAAIGESEE